jgi:signal transduction histidine kinase
MHVALPDRTIVRDRIAIAVAMIAAVAGIVALSIAPYDSGIRLTVADGRIVVRDIDQHSYAFQGGIRTGMVVTELNGTTLLRLPALVYPSVQPTPDADGNDVAPEAIGVDPAVPTPIVFPADQLNAIADRPILELQGIEPWALGQGSAEAGWAINQFSDNGRYTLDQSLPAVFLGLAILLVAGWWLGSGRAGASLQSLAVPLSVATSTPFLVRPLEATWSPPLIALGAILLAIAMVPLAVGLIDRIADPEERRLVTLIATASTVGAVALGIGLAINEGLIGSGPARWVLLGTIPLIPGLAAAGPIQPGLLQGAAPTSGRLLESTEYAVAGATPLVALATDTSPYVVPFALWVAFLLVAGRFTVRPLARLANRATLQRDLVVAATEAERARVAADIHDDALQELTLLVQRLDTAGDTEGAEIARTVSDRLRAICGDLRLPILDDLGVGPALDWLVLRIERLAGGEVRLERSDGTRPPADVELAFFRVAQEALANAVKHGSPPIVVRYASTSTGVSLSIDDAGPGIAADAGVEAERSGHFGLLNMEQRAEAIGAILDVRRWPAGGTHVALEWRAR